MTLIPHINSIYNDTNSPYIQYIYKYIYIYIYIRSVYFSLELTLLGLQDSEKELINIFRSYFNKIWINRNVNLSVFYYEKTTNNGAESYHKCLKSYFKTPHPNIWKFMGNLNNVITDYDIELQRLLENHETTPPWKCLKCMIEKKCNG